MQMNADGIFSDASNGVCRQPDFLPFHLDALGGEGLSNIRRAHRAEELAFVAGFSGYRNFMSFELHGPRLCRCQGLDLLTLELGPVGLDFGQVFLGRRHCFSLGKKIVARVAGLYLDGIAELAQILHCFQKYDLHVESPLI